MYFRFEFEAKRCLRRSVEEQSNKETDQETKTKTKAETKQKMFERVTFLKSYFLKVNIITAVTFSNKFFSISPQFELL